MSDHENSDWLVFLLSNVRQDLTDISSVVWDISLYIVYLSMSIVISYSPNPIGSFFVTAEIYDEWNVIQIAFIVSSLLDKKAGHSRPLYKSSAAIPGLRVGVTDTEKKKWVQYFTNLLALYRYIFICIHAYFVLQLSKFSSIITVNANVMLFIE